MANTADLLKLIDEFGSAFADPEFSTTNTIASLEPTPEAIAEPRTDEDITDMDLCYMHLLQLEHEPELVAIVSNFLEQLASVASLKQHLHNEPIRKVFQDAVDNPDSKIGEVLRAKMSRSDLDLPETYARQGTPECPSGLCSL